MQMSTQDIMRKHSIFYIYSYMDLISEEEKEEKEKFVRQACQELCLKSVAEYLCARI